MNKCCESVRISGLSFYRTKPCGCPARVERDGKHYCLRHDPERKKIAQAKRDAEWRADFERRAMASDRRVKCVLACDGMADPVLMVNALRGFVSFCADTENSLTNPTLAARAKELLAIVKPSVYGNPRPNKPEEPE